MKLRFFDYAKIAASFSPSEVKVGAVIVRGSNILGIGHNNMEKTHPKSPHPFKTIHAEFAALVDAGQGDLVGASIYVFRQYKNGQLAMAKPCRFCEQALRKAGIKICYFTGKNKTEGMTL